MIPKREWRAVHVVAMPRSGTHAIIPMKVYDLRTEHLVIGSWSVISEVLHGDNPEFHIQSQYACQVIDPRLGEEITPATLTAGVHPLHDPTHPILRIHPEKSIDILIEDNPYHPCHWGGTFYVYWILIESVAPILGPSDEDPLMGIRVLLLTGSTAHYQGIVEVRGGCPYAEFLASLQQPLLETGCTPWGVAAEYLSTGKVIRPKMLKMYLCPSDIAEDIMNMLKGVCASFPCHLDNVLHRILWYDWHSGLSVRDIIPGDGSYQLLITPGDLLRPWFAQYDAFMRLMEGSTYTLGLEGMAVPMGEVHLYIATALALIFQEYDDVQREGATSMAQWFACMPGLVKERESIDWGGNAPVDIIDSDGDTLAIAARALAQLADAMCPPGQHW